MAYESTFNNPVDTGSGNQNWNIDPWLYSCRVRLWGGGGGGEFVNTSLVATAGGTGGTTTIFGVSATGGLGGGRRADGTTAKNVGGNGGSSSFSNVPNWTNLGVSFSASNGTGGTLSAGGAAGQGGAGAGGNGTLGFRTYYSSMTHTFNNDTNEHDFANSGSTSDITLSYLNPTAADGIYGTTPSNGKYYGLRFVQPYIDNTWTFEIYGICQQAAGGGTASPYSVNGTANKSTAGMDIWFQNNAGANGYIACFTISTTGLKAGAQGLGGGGGGFVEFNLTRQNLIDAGYNMNPYLDDGTQRPSGDLLQFFVGGGGSSNVTTGGDGRVQIHWYEIPQVYLSANQTTMVAGQSRTLSWYTQGDANSLSFIEGNIDNRNLTSTQVVSPSVTTTYTAQAKGLGGTSYNNEASVTIIVYQPPRIDTFEVPVEIDYGTETINIEYGASYCDIAAKIRVYYRFEFGPDAGAGWFEGETIAISVAGVSPEYEGEPTTEITGTIAVNLPWFEFGPSEYEFQFEIVGSGGTKLQVENTSVIIDRTPDNLDIPDTSNEVVKDLDPVYSPSGRFGNSIEAEGILIEGIDIPVEVKSNYPIQVEINDTNDWKNVRRI